MILLPEWSSLGLFVTVALGCCGRRAPSHDEVDRFPD